VDRNLRAFLAIAAAGNLTAAGERVGLTQPSLTKRLNNLEGMLGCRLFDRHRRGMTLTTAGRHFLRHARRIEQEYLQAGEELRGLEAAGLDVLRVGAGPLFHLRYVAPVFAAVRQRFPLLRLELLADNNNRTIPMLVRGDLDIVLGVIEPVDAESMLVVKPMTDVEHGVVVQAGGKLERAGRLCPEMLGAAQWIAYSDDRDAGRWLNEYFAKHNLGAPTIAARTSSFATGLHLVQTAGLAMMAPVQLSGMIESSGLRVVSVEPPLTRLTAGAYVRESSIGFPAVKLFLDELAQRIGEEQQRDEAEAH
jgi:DNA-binding transcriptional LysR family regulator